MWILNLNPDEIIEINYNELNFPPSFLVFKPIVFKNNGIYFCLLGPDLLKGIFGFGNSINSAISLWDLELKKRLLNPKKDPIAQFVSSKIRMYKNINPS